MRQASDLPWMEGLETHQILSSISNNIVPNVIQTFAGSLPEQEKSSLLKQVRSNVRQLSTKGNEGKFKEDSDALDQELGLPGRPFGPVASVQVKLAADEEDEEEYERELDDEDEDEDEEEYERELDGEEEDDDEDEDDEGDDDEDEDISDEFDREVGAPPDEDKDEPGEEPGGFQLPEDEPNAVKKIKQVLPGLLVGTHEGEALALAPTPAKLINSWVNQYISDKVIQDFLDSGQVDISVEDARRMFFSIVVGYLIQAAMTVSDTATNNDQEAYDLYEQELNSVV
jgi:hypothetical protein